MWIWFATVEKLELGSVLWFNKFVAVQIANSVWKFRFECSRIETTSFTVTDRSEAKFCYCVQNEIRPLRITWATFVLNAKTACYFAWIDSGEIICFYSRASIGKIPFSDNIFFSKTALKLLSQSYKSYHNLCVTDIVTPTNYFPLQKYNGKLRWISHGAR